MPDPITIKQWSLSLGPAQYCGLHDREYQPPHGATKPLDGSSSSQIANMQQDLPAKGSASSEEGSSVQQGSMYVGDGLPPVPAKIAAKIGYWEFIEMYELLPEF